MSVTVGQTLELTLDDIAFGGEGVARLEDFVLFVPFTQVGEQIEAQVVEVKKRFGRAKLLRILKRAPDRVEPPCPYFGDCGGCRT